MPRRREVVKRMPLPDPAFNSVLVSQFVNALMWDGKKRTSERVFYGAMEKLKDRAEEEPLKVFKKAIENCKPTVEVKSRRVGGANYQVPIEVDARRRTSLAIRWLISFARSRTEKSMAEKLCNEFLDAAANRGSAIKRRDDIHRMAEANKAFAHYRW